MVILGQLYSLRASLVAQLVKNLPESRRPGFNSWVGKMPWKRKWQPTLVFLPGGSYGQRRLAGYSPRGRKSQDTIYWLNHHHHIPWGTWIHNRELRVCFKEVISDYKLVSCLQVKQCYCPGIEHRAKAQEDDILQCFSLPVQPGNEGMNTLHWPSPHCAYL